MARQRSVDPAVQALCSHHDHVGDPEALARRLADDLRHQLGENPPVDLEVLASLLGAEVERRPANEAGAVRWDGKRYVITISDLEAAIRQRFTLAHEIGHIFFMEASDRSVPRVDHNTASFDWSRQEEYLCDAIASELLLPAEFVVDRLPARPNMDDVMSLAAVCDVSIEATARRVVQVCSIPGAVVILEPKLKPVEQRALMRAVAAPAFSGMAAPPPERKLRVRYSVGEGLGFIPKDKSVAPNSPLANILKTEAADFVGPTGFSKGDLAVSARLLPVVIDDERVDRVIALCFDADVWEAAAG